MRSAKFYVLLLIVVGGLFALQWFISSRSFAEAKLTSLSSFQEKQLEIFTESDSLLTTLATAAIGAIGAFVFNRYLVPRRPDRPGIAGGPTRLHRSVLGQT
jgi:hypothetical protein